MFPRGRNSRECLTRSQLDNRVFQLCYFLTGPFEVHSPATA